MTEAAPKPTVNIRFLYSVTPDLPATRAFDSETLGMQEAHHMDEPQWGWVVYQVDGFQLMFFRNDEDAPQPFHELWDFQPGDGDERHQGTRMSFSLHVPWAQYRETVARVAAQPAIRKMTEQPTWRQTSDWGWTVKDPSGTTIELYSDPPEQPAEGETPAWED